MSLTNYDEKQFDEDPGANPPGEPEKKPSNRNFLWAIGILGVIFVLALILLLIVAPRLIANQNTQRQETAAAINAANTATAGAATAQRLTQLATTAPPTATKTLVAVKTNTPIPTATLRLSDSELATVKALQTQMGPSGGGAVTSTPRRTSTPRASATALPTTGFADEVGLPGMLGLALVMVLVIVFARRLRASSH